MSSKLTISLVTWNGEKYLRACMDSLLAQSFQDFNLLALDNGSKDNSVLILREYLPKFNGRAELIVNNENVGFAPAHNANINKAQGEYVMLLNQDILLDEDYLLESVKLLDSKPQAGSISGKILRWDFASFTQGLNNQGKTTTIDSLGLMIFKSHKVIEQYVGMTDKPEWSDDMEVFGVSGTVPLYRMSAIKSVAFENEALDQDFFAYKEDVDLAYRLRWAGFSSWVAGRAVAYHDRSARSLEDLPLKEKFLYRRRKSDLINRNSFKNQIFMLYKNLSWRNYFYYFLWIEGYELTKFLYILFREPKTLSVLSQTMKLMPRMKLKRKLIMSTRKISDKEMARWFK